MAPIGHGQGVDEVAVRIDEARHEGLAGEVDDTGGRAFMGALDRLAGTHREDLATLDRHGARLGCASSIVTTSPLVEDVCHCLVSRPATTAGGHGHRRSG